MRLTVQTLNITVDNIEFEEDGVYRLTMPSLTGKGTHTKWFYPEDAAPLSLWKGGQEDRNGRFMPKDERRRVAACAYFDYDSEESISKDSSYGTSADSASPRGHELGRNGWDTDVGSDATELIDEVAEAKELRRVEQLREEDPLPDLPYDRIMRRISEEPTIILDDDPI